MKTRRKFIPNNKIEKHKQGAGKYTIQNEIKLKNN